jgi:hypothetical protein
VEILVEKIIEVEVEIKIDKPVFVEKLIEVDV